MDGPNPSYLYLARKSYMYNSQSVHTQHSTTLELSGVYYTNNTVQYETTERSTKTVVPVINAVLSRDDTKKIYTRYHTFSDLLLVGQGTVNVAHRSTGETRRSSEIDEPLGGYTTEF